jgi:hypothetical protein
MRGSVDAHRWPIIVALLFLPMAISAQELTLGVDFESAYERRDNSGRGEDEDDFSFRIAPDALLEDDDGELQWRLRYRPDYEQFVEISEESGWTHRADGELSWQINPTTRLELSDRFGLFRSVSRFNEVVSQGEGGDVADVTETRFRDEETIRNTVDASLTHRLTPTQMLIFSVGHNLNDYDREERSDSDTLSVTGHYTHSVSRRNTLGGGLSFRRSSFDGTSVRGSQSTDYYNVFGSWSHQFDETLSLSVAAGPVWVKSDDEDNLVVRIEDQLRYPLFRIGGENRLVKASSCPTEDGVLVLTAECDVIDANLTTEEVRGLQLNRTDLELAGSVPSGSNDSLTYFANVILSKRWEQWSGELSYRRQESGSSGLGSSTIADIVTGVLDWKPSPRWHSSLRIGLTRESSATEGVQSVVAVMPSAITFPPLVSGRTFSDVAESFALKAVEVDQDIDFLTLSLHLAVRYRLTKRTTLFGNALYRKQESDGDSGVGRDFDRFRAGFGVSYTFDPIPL